MEIIEFAVQIWAITQLIGTAVGLIALILAVIIFIKNRKEAKEHRNSHLRELEDLNNRNPPL